MTHLSKHEDQSEKSKSAPIRNIVARRHTQFETYDSLDSMYINAMLDAIHTKTKSLKNQQTKNIIFFHISIVYILKEVFKSLLSFHFIACDSG
jgi:hypothetical protein